MDASAFSSQFLSTVAVFLAAGLMTGAVLAYFKGTNGKG